MLDQAQLKVAISENYFSWRQSLCKKDWDTDWLLSEILMIKVSCNLIEGELILIFEIFCKHRENSKHFCFVRNWLIFLTLKYILSGYITQTKKRKLWLVWPYRTKTGSLRCYLPFITNFRQKSTIIINCFHWYILSKTSTILMVTESWNLIEQEHFGRAYTDFAES